MSSAFKKKLQTEDLLYKALTTTLSQTLAEVFATVEHYSLLRDDRIATKKASKQADQPAKQVSQKNDKPNNKIRVKRKL